MIALLEPQNSAINFGPQRDWYSRAALTNPTVEESKMADTRLCSINGCGKPRQCGGYCSGHYYRFKRYGDPMAGRTQEGEPLRLLKAILHLDSTDCVFWPFAAGSDGYGQVRFNGRMWRPSRLICVWAHGEPASLTDQAGHSCGNGHLGCVNPQHLSWRSPQENTEDKRAHGTILRGERHPSAKLTMSDVDIIKGLFASMSQGEIAKRFGVSQASISAILLGKKWL